jgi:hypothetical protein
MDQWLLKHTVSFLELFVKMSRRDCEYKVVDIHPVIFKQALC